MPHAPDPTAYLLTVGSAVFVVSELAHGDVIRYEFRRRRADKRVAFRPDGSGTFVAGVDGRAEVGRRIREWIASSVASSARSGT
jgi:hypothetical protein